MNNYISMFADTLKTFGNNHNMIDEVKFIRGESDLDKMVFDKKTLLFMMTSADIDNEDGNPIYEVNYVAAIVDKAAHTEIGSTGTVEESLFILSQLQDHLQNEGWSAIFGTVDIAGDFDLSGELVVLSTEFTAQFSRGLCRDIDI